MLFGGLLSVFVRGLGAGFAGGGLRRMARLAAPGGGGAGRFGSFVVAG